MGDEGAKGFESPNRLWEHIVNEHVSINVELGKTGSGYWI
jgi:hypothetical protein